MSEDGDSWLKSALGFDVQQVLPTLPSEESLPLANHVGVLGGGLFGELVTAGSTAVSESAPVIAGGAAAGGVVGGLVVAGGVIVGAAAPIIIGHIVGHAEELDGQSDPDERSLPGGVGPDLRPDGGVDDDRKTPVPQGEEPQPLPERPTEIPKGPGFDPTIRPGPAPDFAPDEPNPFEDPFNPRIPRPPRLPEFPEE